MCADILTINPDKNELNKLGWICEESFNDAIPCIEKKIREMKRHMPFYIIVKRVGMEMGFWRNRPRGNPNKGFEQGFGKKKV